MFFCSYVEKNCSFVLLSNERAKLRTFLQNGEEKRDKCFFAM